MRPQPRHRPGERLARDLPTVDPKSLGPALQVRGREGPDPLAQGPQHTLGGKAHGPLALRARHMDDRQLPLRVADRIQQRPDRAQIKAGARTRVIGRALAVDQTFEIARCVIGGPNLSGGIQALSTKPERPRGRPTGRRRGAARFVPRRQDDRAGRRRSRLADTPPPARSRRCSRSNQLGGGK